MDVFVVFFVFLFLLSAFNLEEIVLYVHQFYILHICLKYNFYIDKSQTLRYLQIVMQILTVGFDSNVKLCNGRSSF